jgi:hypothetical protein
MVAAYGSLLFLFAWGGGRSPLTMRSLFYVVVQTMTKVFDGGVITTCIVGEIQVGPEGRADLPFVTAWKQRSVAAIFKGWNRRSSHAVALGVIYFGLRIVDGWLMASMPMNTAPFLSLASKLIC